MLAAFALELAAACVVVVALASALGPQDAMFSSWFSFVCALVSWSS